MNAAQRLLYRELRRHGMMSGSTRHHLHEHAQALLYAAQTMTSEEGVLACWRRAHASLGSVLANEVCRLSCEAIKEGDPIEWDWQAWLVPTRAEPVRTASVGSPPKERPCA